MAATLSFEPGSYVGKVIRWALVKAKNEHKTPTLAITFLPLGRLDPQNPDGDLLECPELERTLFRPITEKTKDWLRRDLKDLFGYEEESFAPLNPESKDAFDFGDKEFPVFLTYEEYEGKTREKWNFPTSPNLGEPMTEDEIKKLDSLYGVAKPRKNGRKAKAPRPVQEAATTEATTPAEPVPI